MKKWKILKEKDVSPSKWFPIKQHEVELPNGTTLEDYFIATLGNVGMVLPITVDNKIVLVKQYKHGVGEVMIELPAGFQQKNKSIEESALAELEEETGIKTTLENLKSLGKISSIPTKSTLITHGFLATGLKFNSTQQFDETEEIELLLRSPKETIELIKDGEIWVGDSAALIMKAMLLYPEIFRGV